MPIVLTDAGAEAILSAYFAGAALSLRLYTNAYTPLDTSIAASFTEASGGGYAAKSLAAGSWAISTVGGIAQAAYAQQTFAFTGALDGAASARGYYVTAGAVVVWAEEQEAYAPASNGGSIAITPVFKLSKGTPT